MPSKPKPTVKNRAGVTVPSRAAPGAAAAAVRARGMRHYGTPEHMRAAIRIEAEDRRMEQPQAGRYTRVANGIVKEFRCSVATAKRAIQAVRAYNMALLEERQPTLIAELVEEHLDIADRAKMVRDFAPAVAALREVGKLTGIYAPKRIEVGGEIEHRHVTVVQLQLDALIAPLDDEGRRAFELVLAQWDAAERTGRLVLPEPEVAQAGDDEEDDDDAPAPGNVN